VYVVVQYNKSRIDNYDNEIGADDAPASIACQWTRPASPYHAVDYPQPQPQELPADCFPKDRLARNLLGMPPTSNGPEPTRGQGDVADQNFLTAGYHRHRRHDWQHLKIANPTLEHPPNPAGGDSSGTRACVS
jgi:hypothetical protein